MRSLILPAIVAVLALADGLVHLSLDFVLFRGNLLGRIGPPAGAPPPGANPPPAMPLPLNQLFLLNFVAYVVLAVLIWFGRERLSNWRWVVDLGVLVVAGLAIAGWFELRRPNPMNLGYLSKSIEVVLIVFVLAHLWSLLGDRQLATRPAT